MDAMSACRRSDRSSLLCVVGATALAVACGLVGAADGYRFIIPDVAAMPGAPIRVAVRGEHRESIQGFSLGMVFPAADLRVSRIHYDDTILDAIGVDFFEVFVDNDTGFFTVGCLVDSRPPFAGQVIPSIGRPLDFFYIEAAVSPDATVDLEIAMSEGLHAPRAPPVENVFVVRDLPIEASSPASGRIRLPFEDVALFIRGDVTLDAARDMTDAISLLDYLFRGGRAPRCFDAADANDDRVVDLSDSIFLLTYLFVGGGAPPPPSSEPDVDPTADQLGCEDPLDVRRVFVAPRG